MPISLHKDKAKRIAVLMSNIGCGGAEIQSISLLNGLCKKGFKIKVLILDTERTNLAGREALIKSLLTKRYFDISAFSQVKKHRKFLRMFLSWLTAIRYYMAECDSWDLR